MGIYLHRTNKTLSESTSPASLPEPIVNYISDPDMSAVAGVPTKYLVITGDVVSEMDQMEKDAVDLALLTARRNSEISNAVDNIESVMRQLIKSTISELNILRAEHGLPDRTIAQFKAQILDGLGS